MLCGECLKKIQERYFIMIDADNTYDISNINKNINLMKKESYEMMVAKRIPSDSHAYRRGHVLEIFFSKLVNVIFGNDVTDIFSGFRIFTKDL